jgi:hypothetical protein
MSGFGQQDQAEPGGSVTFIGAKQSNHAQIVATAVPIAISLCGADLRLSISGQALQM